MQVVVDIEALGRGHESTFAVAFCTQFHSQIETRVFYLTPRNISPNTLKWWVSDPARKKFVMETVLETYSHERDDEIKAIRDYMDEIWRIAGSEEVTIFSDFPTFDLGFVNAILAEKGYLPLYMRSDGDPPCDVVDYVTLLRGIVKAPPDLGSTKTFLKANLERPKRAENHDPNHDVRVIMQEVNMVLGLLN